MKGNKLLAIFAISALLVSITGNNFAYAGYSSDDNEEEEQREKELKEERKQRIEEEKQRVKELREEYKIKLEEKKKIFLDYEKELKEKYNNLKNEFKEKYAQLRISSITELDEDSDDDVELEIKRKELRLLEHEFRKNIKNLKLEAKQHFDELKGELKAQEDDRKNKIRDRISELKEKYKDKIREHKTHSFSDLESYPEDYESKKIEVCHIPAGDLAKSHTLHISVNALKAHLAHGDYMDECEEAGDDEINDEEFDLKIRAETLGDKSEVKVELKFLSENTEHNIIVEEIIENFALSSEEVDEALKIEEEDDSEFEEKFEIEIYSENEVSQVEVELRFILDTTDRLLIIDAIVEKTQLTCEQIQGVLGTDFVECVEDENEEGQHIQIEIKEELGIAQKQN